MVMLRSTTRRHAVTTSFCFAAAHCAVTYSYTSAAAAAVAAAAAAATATADVEAEKRYQEKRAAEKAGEPLPPPPVVLWRSARELGVWVKDLRRARTTGALGGAAYAAAALVDRAHVSGVHWGGREMHVVL
jgi:hypothetical protein